MTQTHRIWSLAQAIVDKAGAEGLTLATAESCTGGLIGAAITDVPGSSSVFDRGFVTYSNAAKSQMLNVPPALIERWGAVSGPVAAAMARGARKSASVDVAISVTGVAGPTGGNAEKPVGLVWFGLATSTGGSLVERRVFANGSRDFVRTRSVETALMLCLRQL